MLTYQPALDPYHSAFRILRILSSIKSVRLEIDKVRILDFLLAFPEVLLEMRLPPKMKARVRRLPIKKTDYSLTTSPRVVFARMAPFQHQAVRLLSSAKLLRLEEPNHLFVHKSDGNEIPPHLKAAVDDKNRREIELISIIAHDLSSMPLSGQDGLKARTNLMEFRYDPV